jgi:hypothetical protein
MVEPDSMQSIMTTVEMAIATLGLTLVYAPDPNEPRHRIQVSRERGMRQVTYVFESNLTAADVQELIAAIRQDFPPIAYDI